GRFAYVVIHHGAESHQFDYLIALALTS
ncbi:MAG: hypothetical protein H6Q76_1738, partial [Firmicutes bacterium]|nr:hypothetical protein [Bacillota bacterium]